MKINPNGWVPVLSWDDGAMYECAAITMFLCDRYPEAQLAPKLEAPERSLFLQTLLYFASSVQIAFQLDYHPYRFADMPEDERSAPRRVSHHGSNLPGYKFIIPQALPLGF